MTDEQYQQMMAYIESMCGELGKTRNVREAIPHTLVPLLYTMLYNKPLTEEEAQNTIERVTTVLNAAIEIVGEFPLFRLEGTGMFDSFDALILSWEPHETEHYMVWNHYWQSA